MHFCKIINTATYRSSRDSGADDVIKRVRKPVHRLVYIVVPDGRTCQTLKPSRRPRVSTAQVLTLMAQACLVFVCSEFGGGAAEPDSALRLNLSSSSLL